MNKSTAKERVLSRLRTVHFIGYDEDVWPAEPYLQLYKVSPDTTGYDEEVYEVSFGEDGAYIQLWSVFHGDDEPRWALAEAALNLVTHYIV